ncbi:hemerythrin domain-containing protein [Halomonas garicola]|uniref:hemerythrin domain-containing protein n=1 Tax=Halomonas garicola TaxID=1690008 RepID=UPI0028A08B81|nr:hemerythrin domain-containing protein [Halomonas garicola]
MSTALFERLYADHERYEALLCILDRQLHVAACQEVPDYRLLERIFRYLNRQPEEWHHRAEDQLFQWLAEQQPESQDLFSVLTEEHRRFEVYGRELETKTQRLADNGPGAEMDNNTFNLARAFSELYHHHIYTEDHRIFPRIEAAFHTESLKERVPLPPATNAEDSPEFQQLFHQIADERKGLELGHGRQAIYCPLCGAEPVDEASR